ncbi:MAG: 7-carboxy-7-deazaguanine synthase QueE [Candidatus Methanospirareceae archaeon]
MGSKKYRMAETFYSIQGEGVQTGTPMYFLRFAGCNLSCPWCDTEYAEKFVASAEELRERVVLSGTRWVCFTGGEPSLQVDAELVDAMKDFRLAIETNGTRLLPEGIDWVTVSPKEGAELVLEVADEAKYVIKAGDPLPDRRILSRYHLLSPVFDGDRMDPSAVEHCISLVKHNPGWRLSVQVHKWLGVQ